VRALIEALRPRQWVKNGLLFAGLIFSKNLTNVADDLLVLGAFGIFCALSSSVYLINDLADIERDRVHPVKCRRPLPSGRLSPGVAVVMALALGVGGLAGGYLVHPAFLALAACYYVLNLAYSFLLKHLVIVDVLSIAIGFVLRAAAGAEAIQVEISPWLLICTVLLALFLALSKRRHELVLLEGTAGNHRRILEEYSPHLLDQMIAVVTASTVVSYCQYTMAAETVEKFGTSNLVFTVPFVLFGIFRYLYLVHQKDEGGSPERIPFTDPPMIANLVLWLVTVGIVLYGR